MSGHVFSNLHRDAADSFRSRLRRELAARCARNPRYSIRAFAAYLEVDHASLSQMMRGTRTCSAQTIKRLGARMGLTAGEIADCISAEEVDRVCFRSTGEFKQRAADAASVLANWCAFAILELLRTKDFRPDVRWIARVLGVEPAEVQITLQQLIRLGFLQMKRADHWVDLSEGSIIREEQFTDAVLDRLATRSLDAQRASARNDPDGPRIHGTLTMAVTRAEAVTIMAAAQRLLDDIENGRRSRESRAATDLYHFEVNCFPITRNSPTSGKEQP